TVERDDARERVLAVGLALEPLGRALLVEAREGRERHRARRAVALLERVLREEVAVGRRVLGLARAQRVERAQKPREILLLHLERGGDPRLRVGACDRRRGRVGGDGVLPERRG